MGLTQGLDGFLRKNFPIDSTESLSGRQLSTLRHFVCSPLAYSPCTIEHWNAALRLFDEATSLAEETAVPRLRSIISCTTPYQF